MATKVGDGYIEIEPRFNRQMFNRMAGVTGRESSTAFNKGFERGTRNLTTNLENSLRQRIPRAFGRGFDGVDREVNRVTRRVNNNVDRDSRGWGTLIGRHLAGGIEGVLSLMPARLEAIFTKTGPVIGTALMAGLAGALAIGLPAIGAMAAGALFAGMGLGAAFAAVLVGVAKDPRVSAAASRIGKTWNDKIIMAKGNQNLGAVLAKQLDKVNVALERWAPSISNILQAGAKFLPPITDALIRMGDIFLPAMDRLMNSKFMMDIMTIFANALPKITKAFTDIGDKFLANPKAQDGAKKGLQALIDLIVWGITQVGAFLVKMSEFWSDLNKKGADGKSIIDKVRDSMTNVGHAIQTMWGIVSPILSKFIKVLNDVWHIIHGLFTGNWQEIGGAFKNFFVDVMQTVWQSLKGTWDLVQKVFGQLAQAIWVKLQDVWKVMQGWGQNIVNWWNNTLNFIKNLWTSSWTAIANFVIGIFQTIQNWISGAISWVRDRIAGVLNNIRTFWVAVWTWIRDFVAGIWNTIRVWVSGAIQWVHDRVAGVLFAIRNIWSTVWTFIRDFVGGIWNTIRQWVAGALQWLYDRINGVINAIRNIWQSIWSSIRDFVGMIWDTIRAWVSGAIQWVHDRINGVLGAINGVWQKMWNGMKDFFGGIWQNIVHFAEVGMNAVIDVINKAIGILNKALEKIGVGFKIDPLGHVGAQGALDSLKGSGLNQNVPRKNRAGGGRIYGPGTPTSDSVPINASRDEFMIKAKSAKKAGYSNLAYLNTFGAWPHGKRADIPGFAGGGRVGPGNDGLLNEHRNHVHVAMAGPNMSWPQIVAAAKRSGIPFQVGSTYRPGSRGSGGGLDHHSEGRAVDFPGYNQDALASYFEHLAGVIELIHRTNKRDYAIFGGKGGGGIMSGIFQWLGKGWNWVVDHLIKPAGDKAIGLIPESNGFMAMGKGWVKKSWEAITKKIKGEFDDAKKAMDSGAGGGIAGGAQQWAGVAASALNMLGLPQNWLGPLLARIQQESGGNPRAINLWDSNAKAGIPSMGLMQTIGPTFNAYKLPGFGDVWKPLDNILAGLRYIKARYGSIFNLPKGGYDNGGWLMPGTAGINMSGKPEMVLNHAQGAALENRIAGDGDGWEDVNIDVYLHDDVIETVIRRKDQELARKTKARKRYAY